MYIHNTYTIKVQEFSVTSTRIRCKSISLPYFFHDIPLYKIEIDNISHRQPPIFIYALSRDTIENIPIVHFHLRVLFH